MGTQRHPRGGLMKPDYKKLLDETIEFYKSKDIKSIIIEGVHWNNQDGYLDIPLDEYIRIYEEIGADAWTRDGLKDWMSKDAVHRAHLFRTVRATEEAAE